MRRHELTYDELREAWPLLDDEDRLAGFNLLDRPDGEALFNGLDARDQVELLRHVEPAERRSWLRVLDPDDAADLLQEAEENERAEWLELLDPALRKEVTALMAYKEDEAGGLMNPRFARLRPDATVEEAISYLRRQTRRSVESIYYAYVLDAQQKLLGAVSLRELVTAPAGSRVRDIMVTDLVTASDEMHQEDVGRLFAEYDLLAIPVVDADGRMQGVVTVDDIVDVVQEEATEDIQKLGGTEALDEPYLQIGLPGLLRKRVGWLAVLLILGIGSVLVMDHFQGAMAAAAALAVFVPLIISSGGNSGSQASTLVVRAMALGEVKLTDWWRVIRREIAVGLALGSALGGLGLCVVTVWHFGGQAIGLAPPFGEDYLRVAATISFSIVAVALWGTLIGSMLPFLLRRVGFDPASASAPLVATIVDASGLVLYFSIASVILHPV